MKELTWALIAEYDYQQITIDFGGTLFPAFVYQTQLHGKNIIASNYEDNGKVGTYTDIKCLVLETLSGNKVVGCYTTDMDGLLDQPYLVLVVEVTG